MDFNKIIAKDIANRYTFHKQCCTLNAVNGSMGDFCSCNIRERRVDLANEILDELNKKEE